MGLGTWIGGALGSLAGPLGTAGGAALGTALEGGVDGGGGNVADDREAKIRQAWADAQKDPHNPNYKPNAYNPGAWGGTNGAGDADVGMFRGVANGYANLRDPGTDWSGANGYMANGADARGMSMDARGSQQDALGMMQSAAQGNAPSVAQIQQQQGMNNAMASQLSLAAGARGASGLAQAGYTAAGNVAGLQGQAATQGGMLRAGEMAQARGAYGDLSSGMRGQDLGQQGQDLANAGLMDARAQFGSNMGLNYRQLGMQGQLAYDQMGNQIRGAQMGQYQNSEANRLQQFGIQMGRDAGSAHDANSNYQFAASQAIGGVKGAAGGAGAAGGKAGA